MIWLGIRKYSFETLMNSSFQKWAQILFTNMLLLLLLLLLSSFSRVQLIWELNNSDSGLEPAFSTTQHVILPRGNTLCHLRPSLGVSGRPSAFSPYLAHPWTPLTCTKHPQHRLYLPLHSLASSLPHVQPGTGGLLSWISLGWLVKATVASGPARPSLRSVLPSSTSAQLGPHVPPRSWTDRWAHLWD